MYSNSLLYIFILYAFHHYFFCLLYGSLCCLLSWLNLRDFHVLPFGNKDDVDDVKAMFWPFDGKDDVHTVMLQTP